MTVRVCYMNGMRVAFAIWKVLKARQTFLDFAILGPWGSFGDVYLVLYHEYGC